MRTKILIVAAVLCAFCTMANAQKRKPAANPCSKARTQIELNQCYCDQYQKADAELNQVYQKLVAANKDDQLFLDKLKAAEQAWIIFRDAQLAAIYPVTDDPRVKYGSIYPMCYCLAQTELTQDRIKQLRRMLKSEEGDGCAWDVH